MKPIRRAKALTIFVLVSLILGCSDVTPSGEPVAGRWYWTGQVAEGRDLFQTHCAACHGESAAGTVAWRETDEHGVYPPPPLNGTAHAWHHPMTILVQTVANGGAPVGGVMPAFRGTLEPGEIRATIAYFQSFWTDEIYQRWQDINERDE